jgi:hypothetical protein
LNTRAHQSGTPGSYSDIVYGMFAACGYHRPDLHDRLCDLRDPNM